MSSWEARTFRPRGRRSLADRLRERYASVRAWIRMSLTVRVVALIVLVGIVFIGLVGAFILSQVRTQLFRVPRAHPFPRLHLRQAGSIDAYDMDDIDASQGYEHHPTIKAPVAV